MRIQFRKTTLLTICFFLMLAVISNTGVGIMKESNPTQLFLDETSSAPAISIRESVLTQHNDNARTGAYLAETQLKPANVNSLSFGRIYSLHVDGEIAAQPLYVKGVLIGSTQKDVLYVVTRKNKIYAFDVGDTAVNPTSRLIWERERELRDINGLGAAAMPGSEDGPKPCFQTRGPVGITSTPVIDPITESMYLVFRTGLPPDPNPNHHNKDYRVQAHYWLAAIDIRTSQDKHAPVEVIFQGFDANMQLNRPGLLMLNGVIYLGFGPAVCDHGGNPYLPTWEKPKPHGWVFAYRARDLVLLDAFNTTKKTALAGVWQSGNGLAGDASGAVYAFTGNNGTERYKDVDNTDDKWVLANDGSHITELGNSILKLRLGVGSRFGPAEHFTAGNWFRLDTGRRFPGDTDIGDDAGDSDLGSGGPVLLSNRMIIGGGKQGVLYVIDPANMIQAKQSLQAFYNTWHPETHPCDYDKVQRNGPNIHGGPVVWRPAGANYTLVYGMPEKEYLKIFKALDNRHVDEHPVMTTLEYGIRSADGMPGAALSLSANGNHDGIVWASLPIQNSKDASTTDGNLARSPQFRGRLMAFDALTLKLLWSANDTVAFAKFVPPTIGQGKVFRAAYKDEIIVYGLRNGIPDGNPTDDGSHSLIRPITAVWQNNNHLDLFMTAQNGTIVSTFWEGNTWCKWRGWRGWFPIKPSTGPQNDLKMTARGQPITAVWSNPNHLDLFMTDKDGVVKSTFWELNEGWRDWFSIKPATAIAEQGQPITAVWSNPHHLDLFMTARDGRVLSTFWEDNGGWRDWFAIRPSTGAAAPGQLITAVWSNPNHLDLFMTDKNGIVKTTYWEARSGWRNWFAISASTGRAMLRQPITAVWSNPNHLDIFMTDKDGTVRSTFWESQGGWREWFVISSATRITMPGQPITAVWSNPNHLDIFMTDKDGTVRSTFWESQGGWREWFVISPSSGAAVPGQRITAVWSNPNHLDLFITAKDGMVKSTFWEANGGWRQWFSI